MTCLKILTKEFTSTVTRWCNSLYSVLPVDLQMSLIQCYFPRQNNCVFQCHSEVLIKKKMVVFIHHLRRHSSPTYKGCFKTVWTAGSECGWNHIPTRVSQSTANIIVFGLGFSQNVESRQESSAHQMAHSSCTGHSNSVVFVQSWQGK